eukprot:3901485-Prymnesium_polylepis.1
MLLLVELLRRVVRRLRLLLGRVEAPDHVDLLRLRLGDVHVERLDADGQRAALHLERMHLVVERVDVVAQRLELARLAVDVDAQRRDVGRLAP